MPRETGMIASTGKGQEWQGGVISDMLCDKSDLYIALQGVSR